MSEPSMKERIARRLCTCDEQNGGPPWDHPIHEGHARYFECADAVLAEMETPDEGQLNAARDWSCEKYSKPIGNDAAIGCYSAMIRAARAGR